MRVLFCNSGFPGRFEVLARYLGAAKDNEVLFAALSGRRDVNIPGARRAMIRKYASGGERKQANFWNLVQKGSQAGEDTFVKLRESGFKPDLILSAAECVEAIFLRKNFPDSFHAAYFNACQKNALWLCVQGQALLQCDAAFATEEACLPDYLMTGIMSCPVFIDTEFYNAAKAKPFTLDGQIAPGPLISIYLRGFEHLGQISPVIGDLLNNYPACQIVLLCGGQSQYDSLSSLDLPNRLHLAYALRREEYRDLLCVSSLHIMRSATASEALEVLSCGCLLACAQIPVHHLLQSGKTLLRWPDNTEEQLRLIHKVLSDNKSIQDIRKAGAEIVRKECNPAITVPAHLAQLIQARDRWLQGSGRN